MKQKIKKLLIFIIIFLAALEVTSYLDFAATQIKQGDIPDTPYSYPPKPFEKIYEQVREWGFGKVYGENKKGKPLALFIASDASGESLPEKEQLGYIISERFKIPVYNRAYGGWGMQNMYWQFDRDDFYKEVSEPQAVLLIYYDNLNYNTYVTGIYNTLKYDIKDGKFVRQPNINEYLSYSYAVLKIRKIVGKMKAENTEKSLEMFNSYLLACKEKSQKHWKNTKFIVVKNIDEKTKDDPKYWQLLKDEGIIIIELSDILGQEYTDDLKYKKSKDDNHPTSNLMEKIAVSLDKYLEKGQ